MFNAVCLTEVNTFGLAEPIKEKNNTRTTCSTLRTVLCQRIPIPTDACTVTVRAFPGAT